VYLQSGVHKCRGRFSATARTRRQRLRTVFGNCQHPSTTTPDGFRQLPAPADNDSGRFSATARTRRQRLRTVFGNCQDPSATTPDGFRHLPEIVRNAPRVVIWPLNRVTYVGRVNSAPYWDRRRPAGRGREASSAFQGRRADTVDRRPLGTTGPLRGPGPARRRRSQ